MHRNGSLIQGGIHGPLRRVFGLGWLGRLVMLSSKSLGRYSSDFRDPTFGILDELTGASWGLVFRFSLGAWGGGSLEG